MNNRSRLPIYNLYRFVPAANVMLLALEILGAIGILTFIFIGIWSFVVFNKLYAQLKYKNYLLEKINENLYLNVKNNLEDKSVKDEFSEDNIVSFDSLSPDEKSNL